MISKRHFRRQKKLEIEKFREKFRQIEAACNEKEGDAVIKISESEVDEVEPDADVNVDMEDVPVNIIESTINDKLKKWYIKHKPKRECVRDLVNILSEEHLDVKPFYKFYSPKKPDICKLAGGSSLHVGLTQQLLGLTACSNCNCAIEIEKLEKKLNDIKNTLQQENQLIRDQLQIAIEALADRNVMLKQLIRDRAAELPITTQFPLKTKEELFQMNDLINEDSKDTYVKAMKSLLKPAGVLKNLKHLISNEVITEFNVDGVQGKKCLKNFKNFYNALLDSIPINEGQGPAEDQLRKAIQVQKKRVYKNVCVAKARNAKKQT